MYESKRERRELIRLPSVVMLQMHLAYDIPTTIPGKSISSEHFHRAVPNLSVYKHPV